MVAGVRNDLAAELAFLRYRLSVVERWPEDEYKAAVLAAITYRMAAMERAATQAIEADLPLLDKRGTRKPGQWRRLEHWHESVPTPRRMETRDR